jgi:hypothetical protein
MPRWLDRANKGVVTFSTGLPMYNWPLNDAHLVLLILFCLAVITIGSIVGALTKAEQHLLGYTTSLRSSPRR